MPDLDHTPIPGRLSANLARGRTPVPDRGNPVEGVDPPTVRSGSPVSSGSGTGSGSSGNRRGANPARADIPPLPGPGERVGDFGLEDSIGAGGMGAVFRAIDIKLDRQVALKILPPDQAIDPEVVRRYYQEGRAAARLDHENIARVFSIGHDGRYHFIAFEYIEGTTIRQRVEAGGPLAVGDSINYTLQIANALVHSSSRGVVHRDIKPSNIVVTPQGRAKLVDMGLARRFERGEDTGLTQSGMTLGTFDYISPEQARDPRDVDVRGDLYSLGCTLFHMLSGRPPFPEGTVLQKLLQHQEEAPPDIRKLNPAVPDDLASILVKLMAKDRDRRYQTPEQLVRDLLTVAGSLGLRSINPEGLVWMAPSPRLAPAWARQLVWGVPVAAFLLILGAVAWRGDGPIPSPSVSVDPAPTLPPTRPRGKADTSNRSRPKDPSPDVPREYEVYSRDDLLRAIAEAPSRSTIVLADNGPYEIKGAKSRHLRGLDLTIRAESGLRPTIRILLEPDNDRDLSVPVKGYDGAPPVVGLDLVGGRLTVEGVDFLSGAEGGSLLAAIRAEDAELIVRRCTFHRPSGRSKSSAIAVKVTSRRASHPSANRGGSTWVEASGFEGGQVAVSVSGPAEVNLRDCTFGPAGADQATIWAENPDLNAGAAELGIRHVSVLAGEGPVFRFSGVAPRVRVHDSIFAPPTLTSTAPILVAVDPADRLDWRGVDNLYGRFGAFLQPLRGSTLRGQVRTFDAWADDPTASRVESGSISYEGQPWVEVDPIEALGSGTARASRAYQLALNDPSPLRPGARQGPNGPLLPPVVAASPHPIEPSIPIETNPGRAREVASALQTTKPKTPIAEPDDSMKAMPLTLNAPKSARDPDPDPPASGGDLAPMPMPIPVEPDRPQAPSTNLSFVGPPRPGSIAPSLPPVDANVVRSPEEFREALLRTGPGTKTLVIPADADWTLPACRVRGMASWVIQADRGATRPRLRFRAEASSAVPGEPWSAWMTVQASGLRLEGIDLVVPAPDVEALNGTPASRRRALFAIVPGTIDLTLANCTITIEGDQDSAPSAVVALLAGELGGEGRLRVESCLIRVGGDVVDVAGGRRLDLAVENAEIASGGPMVHAHGLPEGRTAEGLKVALRHVTARMLGGLARLQSAPGEPELPVASINVRDVVLATGDSDTPLLRVDGQGDLERLSNLIRWEGRSVAYSQINTYRRDQSARPGAVPILYDREDWKLRLGEQEESSIHDLKFPLEWPAERRPWSLRRDDLRLPLDSPAVGADLRDIPNPPAYR